MTLEDETKRALKVEYDKVCSALLDEEIIQMSCFRNIPEYLEKKLLRQRIARENPQLDPALIDARATQEYEHKQAIKDTKLNKFVIAEEVRALRKYRKKLSKKEALTPKDEEYIIALMQKVKAEQVRPEYNYYSPRNYQDAEGNPISFEKYVMLMICYTIDQIQSNFKEKNRG